MSRGAGIRRTQTRPYETEAVMSAQNTLYIAEPIFSEKLQRFDSDAAFPPIKKIGITGDPQRRERELLGTNSPVKVSIVKAWSGIDDVGKVESMLHALLSNTRLDGEYFWDEEETLVDAVEQFVESYHPTAEAVELSDDSDVKAATQAMVEENLNRINAEVAPELKALDIQYDVGTGSRRKGSFAKFDLGDYTLRLGTRTGGRYTLTIFSETKNTEDALRDFPGAQSAGFSAGGKRKARISLSQLDRILDSIKQYMHDQP